MAIESKPGDLDAMLRIRLGIEALAADYAHCIDGDRLESWPDFFVDNGAYRVTTRENVDLGLPLSLIFCDGRGMFVDRIVAMRTANIFEPHVYCHMVGSLKLVSSSTGEYETRSNFTVIRTMVDGAMSIFACGAYHDVVVEQSGALKYKSRTVVLDSRCIDTLLVIPL